jgi:hypothetical protein
MNRDNALQTVAGSLRDIAERENVSLQEAFLGARVVVIFDASASMSIEDSANGKRRYDVAVSELHRLQEDHPGQIALFVFSEECFPVPGGNPPFLMGSTDLAGALRTAKIADIDGMQIIVISDGEPDDEEEALAVARTYNARIHGVFAGSEGDTGGRQFLERLTAESGGRAEMAHRAVDLLDSIETLMLEA